MSPSRGNARGQSGLFTRRVAWSSLVVAIVVAFGATWTMAAKPDPDELESYLRSHGLEELVVVHLEDQLRHALGKDRIPIAERLAMMYGEMLDRTNATAARTAWEEKGRDLLQQIPAASTDALRVTIFKGSYLRAERLAELYRLRAVGDDVRKEAARNMAEVSSGLLEMHRTIRSHVRRLEDIEAEPGSAKAAQLTRELRQLDALTSQAAYYAAWARYYESYLSRMDAGLSEAVELFGSLLQAEGGEPPLDELPESLMTFEHVARAALGVALCKAEMGDTAAALDWLDAVENVEGVHPGARDQVQGYRIIILFQAQKWNDVTLQIEKMESDGQMTATMARLIAVLAIDSAPRARGDDARELAAQAINRLAMMGELKQVIEIAGAFDLQFLGSDSFALAYVLALKAHSRAREHHKADEPTNDAATHDLYQQAEESLTAAIRRRDAYRFSDAVANARLLVAWGRYYRFDFEDAANLFEDVSRELNRKEAESAMWMAVVCRDRIFKQTETEANQNILAQTMELFLKRFPSSARAGKVRYRLATQDQDHPTMAQVRVLLAIPVSSEAYRPARNEAERILYLLFRGVNRSPQVEYGHRYLEVALPLQRADHRLALTASATNEERDRYIQRTRRVLDVLLVREIARVSEARTLLESLAAAGAAGLLDLNPIAAELDYRRFQITMLSGEFDRATQWCEELWSRDPGSPYALASTRELYRYAVQDWRAFPNDPNVEDNLDRVVRYGQRLLSRFGDPPDLTQPGVMPVLATVADAAYVLSKRRGDAPLRASAVAWYARLLEAKPKSYPFLKANAEIAEEAGNTTQALEYWRTAAAGLGENRPGWYEAKFHLIRLLFQTDPGRAAEVMAQHRLLHPDYGPTPWGDQLAELDRSIGANASGETRDGGGG